MQLISRSTLVAFLLSTLSTAGCTDSNSGLNIPTEGLVAFYPFDGSATDVSENNPPGIVHGASPASDRFEKANATYAFEEGDYVLLGDIMNSLAVPFSVSAWVNAETFENQTYGIIFASDFPPEVPVDNYHGFWLQIFGGNVGINYGSGGGAGYQWRRTRACELTVAAGTWMHITAVVRGPQDMSLYLNGAEPASCFYDGEGGAEMARSTEPAVAGLQFVGRIDDIAVYDRALTVEEVKQLYHVGGWGTGE